MATSRPPAANSVFFAQTKDRLMIHLGGVKTRLRKLVHLSHAHTVTIPVFTLLVGSRFLMISLETRIKLVLTPVPMLAVLLDIVSWRIARVVEPFIHIIVASGVIVGMAFGLQRLCISGSMWFGRTDEESTSVG